MPGVLPRGTWREFHRGPSAEGLGRSSCSRFEAGRRLALTWWETAARRRFGHAIFRMVPSPKPPFLAFSRLFPPFNGGGQRTVPAGGRCQSLQMWPQGMCRRDACTTTLKGCHNYIMSPQGVFFRCKFLSTRNLTLFTTSSPLHAIRVLFASRRD